MSSRCSTDAGLGQEKQFSGGAASFQPTVRISGLVEREGVLDPNMKCAGDYPRVDFCCPPAQFAGSATKCVRLGRLSQTDPAARNS